MDERIAIAHLVQDELQEIGIAAGRRQSLESAQVEKAAIVGDDVPLTVDDAGYHPPSIRASHGAPRGHANVPSRRPAAA